MASDKLDFGEVLAVLEAKRAALDALIGSFRAAMSIGALGQTGDTDFSGVITSGLPLVGRSSGPVDLPQGALLGKSLPAAIQLLMSAARRKLTTKEIVTALREGGVESTSMNFDNTVTTALHRLKASGIVMKFNDGWALAEFYPENLRNRLAERDAKPARKTKRSTKRSRQKVEAVQGLVGTSMAARILEMVDGFDAHGATIQDVVDALATFGIKVERKYVRGILSREYSLGHLDSKRERGRYFAKPKGQKLLMAAPRAIHLREGVDLQTA